MPFVFTPPTYKRMGYDNAWHRRTSINVGTALIKRGFSYAKTFDPTAEDYDTADIIYMGGRSYLVDNDEGEQLEAAGYGAYLVPVESPPALILIYPSESLFPGLALYPQEI